MRREPAWWTPEIYAGRRHCLLQRARIVKAVRAFFDAQDFLEIEAAALQISPGNEAHIAAFATFFNAPGTEPAPLYLHSSPEFDCKKLLAAGETRIFSLSHVFRNGERSKLHHPEFTMLEWYRAGAPYRALIDDCAALAATVARAAGVEIFQFEGSTLDPFVAPEILSVAEAFARYAEMDLLATLDDGGPNRDALAAQAQKIGLRVSGDDSWSDLFSKILSEKIERRLGHGRLTALIDYPASEAALARRKPDDARLAERFELYGCGVELANAFGELTDAEEQSRRFEAEMAERQRVYGESYPIDADFLDALAVMPEASGIALGFDRLVMLAAGAQKIEQVLWAPVAQP